MTHKKVFRIILSGLFAFAIISCKDKVSEESHQDVTLIPYPQELVYGNGSFSFDPSTKVLISEDSEELVFLADYLSEMFEKSAGFELDHEVKNSSEKGSVFLNLDKNFSGGEEAYRLEVHNNGVTITANAPSGLLYGVQTIRQLLPKEIESSTKTDATWSIPALTINDSPRFEYRGMQMDVSRHFFSVDYLKTFIDRLALFKFNRFHIHLTDDQGWRLQIKQYPELTEEGAWRTMNNHDKVCVENAKTDPSYELPREFFKMKDGEEVYGGSYTQEQMKEIIDYAGKRGITIVPEIDMPGHMKSAIDSFADLTCVDGPGWGQTFSIPLCPCKESVYDFVENVLSEVVDLFPGEYIHIGADEVEKATWENNALCEELMKKEGFETVEELQSYFVKRIEKFLTSKGKKMIGWDEALEGGINPSTTIMYWRGWVPEAPIEAAEGGHDVIMTPTSHCYFDYAPNDTSLSHVYSFDPIPEELKGKHEESIKGVQANLWSEYIPSPARLEYMSMPRMMSLAEVAWTKDKDEKSFLNRVDRIYERLDEMGINYRLPDIKNLPTHVVFIDSASLSLEKPPIIDEIRYTTDGSTPTLESTLYEGTIPVTASTDFAVATFAKGRRAAVYNLKFEKQSYAKSEDIETKPGLKVNYYEGKFAKVADMDNEKVKKSTVESTIKVPEYCRPDEFGLTFEGYVNIPETGIYSFYSVSDDGSTVEIGGRLVVDHDGYHGPVEKLGQIALEKGKHPIKVKFFEATGGERISISYHLNGDEENKVEIPAAMLSH